MKSKIETPDQLAEKIYNLTSILKQHCCANTEKLEEVAQISTMVDYLYDCADRLNVIFLNSDE